MDSCTPVRRILILACLAVPGHAMVGCTVIPQAEFETYRFAFAEARLSGEAMLTDHAAAREDFHRPRPGLAGLNGQIAMAQLQLGLAAAGVPGEDIAALKTQITEARSRIEEAEDDLGALSGDPSMLDQ